MTSHTLHASTFKLYRINKTAVSDNSLTCTSQSLIPSGRKTGRDPYVQRRVACPRKAARNRPTKYYIILHTKDNNQRDINQKLTFMNGLSRGGNDSIKLSLRSKDT